MTYRNKSTVPLVKLKSIRCFMPISPHRARRQPRPAPRMPALPARPLSWVTCLRAIDQPRDNAQFSTISFLTDVLPQRGHRPSSTNSIFFNTRFTAVHVFILYQTRCHVDRQVYDPSLLLAILRPQNRWRIHIIRKFLNKLVQRPMGRILSTFHLQRPMCLKQPRDNAVASEAPSITPHQGVRLAPRGANKIFTRVPRSGR